MVVDWWSLVWVIAYLLAGLLSAAAIETTVSPVWTVIAWPFLVFSLLVWLIHGDVVITVRWRSRVWTHRGRRT